MLNLAKDTPFEIKDLTKSYIMLKNFGLEPTAAVMESLTNQVAKLGGGADILAGVTLALGQAWGKGKLQAEEINQLVERGIPVYSLLTEVTGKQSSELLKMAEKGEITHDIMEKLIVKMGEMASGSNARAMETLSGKISSLSDAWHKFEDTLLQDKSEGILKSIVDSMSNSLNILSRNIDSSIEGKIAHLEAKIKTYESSSLVRGIGFVGTMGQYDVNDDKRELAKLKDQKRPADQALKATTDGDAKKLEESKTLAKSQLDLAEHSKKVAEWSAKYASNSEKLAAELAKARKEMGSDFTPAIEAAITAKFTPKAKKAKKPLEESEMHGFDFGLEQEKIAFEKSNELLGYSKEAAKKYWDDIIASYKGNDKTLAELKKKSADLDLQITRDNAKRKHDLDNESVDASHSAALDDLGVKAEASQQELDLGNITSEQHLTNLRKFAQDRLAVEQKFLDDKRKLLGQDSLLLAQNLNAASAATRKSAADIKAIDNKMALDKKSGFVAMFAPFESAMNGMVQGILTGQNTIKGAVKNAAASIVTSYASEFIKTRVISSAQWAWELSGFGGKEAKKKAIEKSGDAWEALRWMGKKIQLGAQWAWETLGFTEKEVAQTGVKVASEATKTGAQIASDQTQVASTVAAEGEKSAVTIASAEKSIMAKALSAAAGAYDAMVGIPYVGPIIAPIAAAVAFVGVSAFGMMLGSAKGGEWQVGKDGSPYILHENESVLPSGVADNFRKVVSIVGNHTAAPDYIAEMEQLFSSGKIAKQLAMPSFAANMASQSQAAANTLARESAKAAPVNSHNQSKPGETHIHMNGIMLSPEDFLHKHSKAIVSAAHKEARNFNVSKNK
jgi:tape measure domain-containing protein